MKKLKEFFFVILGATVMAIGLDLFLLPKTIAAGGVSGIAAIAKYAFNINPAFVILGLNIPLFLGAFKLMGKDFLLKSMVGTLTLSIMTNLLQEAPIITESLFVSAISGGVLVGLGVGIAMKMGGTTGGTEIAVLLIKRFMPNLSTGKLIMVVDGTIISVSVLVTKSFDLGIYALLSLIISARIIDYVLEGGDFAKGVLIVTSKWEKVSKEILIVLERGVTGISSTGMYTGNSMKTLLCVVKRNELAKLKNIVINIDENAFFILFDAREVWGNFRRGRLKQ